jgi:hypothetical protein
VRQGHGGGLRRLDWPLWVPKHLAKAMHNSDGQQGTRRGVECDEIRHQLQFETGPVRTGPVRNRRASIATDSVAAANPESRRVASIDRVRGRAKVVMALDHSLLRSTNRSVAKTPGKPGCKTPVKNGVFWGFILLRLKQVISFSICRSNLRKSLTDSRFRETPASARMPRRAPAEMRCRGAAAR